MPVKLSPKSRHRLFFIPGRAGRRHTARFLAPVHRNMNTVHSAILPQNTDPINDHDGASKRAFDVYAAYQHALADADVSFPSRSTRNARSLHGTQISPPLAAIQSLTELVSSSDGKATHTGAYSMLYNTPRFSAGTMFELVRALNDGAETLKKRVPNPIGLTAGCELFIGFVTLFPHESAVSKCIMSTKSPASWYHGRSKELFRDQEGNCSPRQRLHFSGYPLSYQDS